jgi:hypothetical protein
MSGYGPHLPTCALQQVGSFLGYTGHQINVVVTAARDPKLPFKIAADVTLSGSRLADAGAGDRRT